MTSACTDGTGRANWAECWPYQDVPPCPSAVKIFEQRFGKSREEIERIDEQVEAHAVMCWRCYLRGAHVPRLFKRFRYEGVR